MSLERPVLRLRPAAMCAVVAAAWMGALPQAGAQSGALTTQAILERVRADLATRRGIPQHEIHTLAVNEVIWRDTSLGCGKPTESYAQIDIEGVRIALEYKGERFDYRARKDGAFILCSSALNSPR